MNVSLQRSGEGVSWPIKPFAAPKHDCHACGAFWPDVTRLPLAMERERLDEEEPAMVQYESR